MLTRSLTLLIPLALLASLLVPSAGAQTQRGIAPVAEPEPASDRRHALIIGNEAYTTAPLKNPLNDARSMAATLRNVGFQVRLLENAEQVEMKRAIDDFGKALREGGVGLFYYSGHGIQVDGENYMVPVTARLSAEEDVEYESVNVGRVLAKMEAARNGMNIVILDACRNNPFARSFRSASQGLATLNAPSGTFISYATAPGSVASDGDGSNGLYTGELVRLIQQPNLKLEDIFKRVRANVQEKSNGAQIPWDASSLTGDFYFNRMQPPEPAPVARMKAAPEPEVSEPPSQYRPDEEAWELVKESDNPEDLAFFIESFPESSLRRVAELKRRMLERRREQKAGSSKPAPPPPAPQPVATAKPATEREARMQRDYMDLSFEASEGKYETFIARYESFSWAADEVQVARKGLAKLRAAKRPKPSPEASSQSGVSQLEARMQFEYMELQFNPSDEKFEAFIQKYESFSWAADEVKQARISFKKRQAPASPPQVAEEAPNSLIDLNTNRRFAALYQEAERKSRETLGCGFLSINCPDPLVFPEFERGFHLKDYRRIKLNGSQRPWLSTDLKLDYGDFLLVFGTGKVTTCPGAQCRTRGPQGLLRGRVAVSIGDNERVNSDLWFRSAGRGSLAQLSVREIGELKLVVRDWSSYPPPDSYYSDNTGFYLLDVFVVELEYLKAFNRFLQAVVAANPEDLQAQSFPSKF